MILPRLLGIGRVLQSTKRVDLCSPRNELVYLVRSENNRADALGGRQEAPLRTAGSVDVVLAV
jgi:hypothetical protein